MISTDADKALRSDDGHLYLLRDSTPDHDGVGSIQIFRPSSEATSEPTYASDPAMSDDGLSAVRGMLLGVVLGVGFWSLLGGLIGMIIF